MCIIKGKNIDLKPMEWKDTENIIHWRNQPFVRKWFIDQRLFTKEGHMAWVEEMIHTGRAVQFIIRLKIQMLLFMQVDGVRSDAAKLRARGARRATSMSRLTQRLGFGAGGIL